MQGLGNLFIFMCVQVEHAQTWKLQNNRVVVGKSCFSPLLCWRLWKYATICVTGRCDEDNFTHHFLVVHIV